MDSVVRSAERLCKVELCCLWQRRKVRVLCFLYKIYHRVDHPVNEYNFIAANTRASAAHRETRTHALATTHGVALSAGLVSALVKYALSHWFM